MVLVDQTAVPLTLPAIMRHYDVGSQSVQWVLNGSLVSLAALLVFGGQLGDMFGRRRIFLAGTIVFRRGICMRRCGSGTRCGVPVWTSWVRVGSVIRGRSREAAAQAAACGVAATCCWHASGVAWSLRCDCT